MNIGSIDLRSPFVVATTMLLCVWAFGVLTIDGFGSTFSQTSMLLLASLLGIAAVGQTLVMLLGGIDLSVPFVIGAANILAAELYGRGLPFGVVIALVLASSAVVGAFNGLVSSRFQVHPLIVTLGTGTFVLGAIQVWNRGMTAGSAPAWVSRVVSPGGSFGPLPVPTVVVLWAVISVGVVLVLRRTSYGKRVYAYGSSPEAARYCLISPTRLWTTTFAVSGFFSGLTGMLLLGFTGGASASAGLPYLFLSVAAVVVGGTSMLGGRGGYGGTILGALLLTALSTILAGRGMSGSIRQMAVGLLILAIVAAYGRQPALRTRI